MRLQTLLLLLVMGCGDDDGADDLGIGAQCADSDECSSTQTCLSFKGGYCGVSGCVSDLGCPADSACIAHDDGINYCFRTCANKSDCNANRNVENEANCSSTATFVDPVAGRKACTPPSGN